MSESRMLQKGSKNLPRKPHGIKGRIHPIRLFHNVWVMKQREKALGTAKRVTVSVSWVEWVMSVVAIAVFGMVYVRGVADPHRPYGVTVSVSSAL
jgi:hypothetical protein